MLSANLAFYLGDQLPTKVNVCLAIFKFCSKPGSQKMKSTINSYANELILIWIKAFGKAHVITKRAVTKKLEKLVKSYYNHVYNKSHRSKPKASSAKTEPKSIRQLN